MQQIIRFFTPVMLFLFLFGCDSSERNGLPLAPSDLLGNPERIELGRQLFFAHCVECHGGLAEGRRLHAMRGKIVTPDFKEKRYRTSMPGYLNQRIAHGRNMEPFRSAGSFMPAWNAYLTQEQIWSLVAYIRDRAGSP